MPTMPEMAVSPDHTLLNANTERGATLAADAQLLAESPAAAEQFRQQAFDILLAGRELAVSVLPAGANNASITAVGVLLQESVAAAV